MKRISFLFLLLIQSTLFGGIEEFFKKPTGKSDVHRMKGIDFIYTINLDQRPEKFESCTKQLHPYGIYPYRFSAVNGWELTLQQINALGVPYDPAKIPGGHMVTCYPPDGDGSPQHEIMHEPGRTYFCHCMSRGAMGIVLSHLSILQDAYDSGYKTIWVMEDDVDVLQNPHLISKMIKKLDDLVGKKGWDVFFTDQDTKNNNGQYVPCTSCAWRPFNEQADSKVFKRRKSVGNEFKQIGARYGAYSMIVRRSGMKKILDFIKQNKVFLPYDMEFCLPQGIKMFAVIKDIVSTQRNAPSDNGGANYERQN